MAMYRISNKLLRGKLFKYTDPNQKNPSNIHTMKADFLGFMGFHNIRIIQQPPSFQAHKARTIWKIIKDVYPHWHSIEITNYNTILKN